MPYVGHLWASCWDPVPLSSHPGIIGTHEQKKAATGLARIPPIGARVHNFPSNECWRDANGSFSAFSTNQRTTPRGRSETYD
jgi:hypothetical protein